MDPVDVYLDYLLNVRRLSPATVARQTPALRAFYLWLDIESLCRLQTVLPSLVAGAEPGSVKLSQAAVSAANSENDLRERIRRILDS